MAEIPVNRRRRALLSVTDKSQLEDVAILLHSFDYELIASGGTARFLREHRFPVTDVSEVTGFPEIFGGRVKTLHPAIHGGILGPSLDDFTDVVDPRGYLTTYIYDGTLLMSATDALNNTTTYTYTPEGYLRNHPIATPAI